MTGLDHKQWIVLLIVLSLLMGCSTDISTSEAVFIEECIHDWPMEGWSTSKPEDQGMDSDLLADMLKEILDHDLRIDSVTIIRNGDLILDVVRYPYKPDTTHIIHSCTKSIVSILIGIAIDHGYINSVEEPLLNFFPHREIANPSLDKEEISLEHVLTMTAGFDCKDSYLYQWHGLHEMMESEDWVQFVLDLPMLEKPGTRFEYCNGASFLLSAIITETTGQNALEFANENLFGPLGISNIEWPTNPQGINIGWGKIHMLPQDMAKIGYLYLKHGLWNDTQIVSPAWIAASTRKHINATLEEGYGYHWWIDDSDYFMALGYAGQFIFVIPEKDLIVVFTSDLDERDFYVPQILLEELIIPSVKSSTPIPANPAGVLAIESHAKTLGNP